MRMMIYVFRAAIVRVALVGGTGGCWEMRLRGEVGKAGRVGGHHRFAILQQGDGG
jgi:hypothetical protein